MTVCDVSERYKQIESYLSRNVHLEHQVTRTLEVRTVLKEETHSKCCHQKMY